MSLDLDDFGTEEADGRYLLALEPLSVDVDSAPDLGAAFAAAIDLITFLLM